MKNCVTNKSRVDVSEINANNFLLLFLIS